MLSQNPLIAKAETLTVILVMRETNGSVPVQQVNKNQPINIVKSHQDHRDQVW